MHYTRVAQLRTADQFRSYLATLGADLPFDDQLLDLSDPNSDLELNEQRRALAEAIANLPPNQRLAFILCHYEEFSYAEAARSLGLSVKAVESLLVRAKRSLREKLADVRKKSAT